MPSTTASHRCLPRCSWTHEYQTHLWYTNRAIVHIRLLPQCFPLVSSFDSMFQICGSTEFVGWLGSRVVSMLDSWAEGPGFKSQPWCCRNRQRPLRVARVTAGMVGSNGSLPPGLWLTSPAGWLPRTGISSGTLHSVIKYGLPLPTNRICAAPGKSQWAYGLSNNGLCCYHSLALCENKTSYTKPQKNSLHWKLANFNISFFLDMLVNGQTWTHTHMHRQTQKQTDIQTYSS